MFDINKIQFDEIPSRIVEIGEKLAKYTAHYNQLDKFDDIKLASLCSSCPTYKDSGKKTSMVEKMNYALQQPEYKKHLEAKRNIQEEMLKHKAYMQALDAKFELMRSLNSLKKAEMRM